MEDYDLLEDCFEHYIQENMLEEYEENEDEETQLEVEWYKHK